MIPFIDLQTQQTKIRAQLEVAIKRVLDHGEYIMGPEVFQLEKELADFCGAKHTISCSNGTDALLLALLAKNIKPQDVVFVPSFTFAATAEAVAFMGAIPMFVDCLEDTYNIDPKSLEQAIHAAKKAGLHAVGIIPVDLFGQPADYEVIEEIANAHNLWIIADAAQSFGASYKQRHAGNLAEITITSFYPAKPLGCYGDGGAVFTNDDLLAKKMIDLRVHGAGADKYDNVYIGMNGRFDTIQAAIMLEKLRIFPQELITRQQIADIYTRELAASVHVPRMLPNTTSAWAQYTIRLPHGIERSSLMSALKSVGIPTVIYYVKPLHQQTAYAQYPTATGGALPVCERLAMEVLSLPMNGYLSFQQAEFISKEICRAVRQGEVGCVARGV